MRLNDRTQSNENSHSQQERNRAIPIQVIVKDNNVEKAIRELKRKLQRDGLYTEMKRRSSYEKPSNKRKRKQREAIRRIKKLQKMQRSE